MEKEKIIPGKVTRIAEQRKRKDRVNIDINGKFAFALSVDKLIEAGIARGDELSEEKIKILKEGDSKTKAFDKAFKLLGYRVRSEKEIRDKLKEKKIVPEIIDEVIMKLKKMDYVNDRKFAEIWIKSRQEAKPTGKYKLRGELFQKGVAEEVINKGLEQNQPDKKEVELAQSVFKKALKKYQGFSRQEKRQKIINFLGRRGFSWNIINKLFDSNRK